MSLTASLFNSGLFKGGLFNGGLFNKQSTVSIVSLLFGASENGVLYDPSDFSTMFQDSAGTTPVTAVGQSVRKILDKSGNNNHAIQPTLTSAPILLQDGSGYYYLGFDGIDDCLFTGDIYFTAKSKMSLFIGVRKLTPPSAYSVIAELSDNGAVGFGLFASSNTNKNVYQLWLTGTSSTSSSSYSAPITNVISAEMDLIANTSATRINSSLEITGTHSLANEFSNRKLYLGRRANTSLPFVGWLYQVIVRDVISSSNEITAAETYVNSKTGAY